MWDATRAAADPSVRRTAVRAKAASGAVAGVVAADGHWRAVLLRQGLPLAIAGLLIWLFGNQLAKIDPEMVYNGLRQIHPLQWLGALMATAVSFMAVGRYDAVIHRQIGTGIDAGQARRAGFAATAISQTIGMGMVIGPLVRWRMLPQIGLATATRLSFIVILGFLGGWAVVASAVVLILPAPVPFLSGIAVLTLCVAGIAGSLCLFGGGRFGPLRVPPLATMLRILLLTAVDIGAAALAFVILMPEAAQLAPASLLPAFLIALGVGLVSGTPGGVGPFELTLVMLLPTVAPEPLLVCILAFRATYYAVPAVIAGLLLCLGPERLGKTMAQASPPADQTRQAMTRRAEAGLTAQGAFAVWTNPQYGECWLLAETGQSLVVLGDQMGRRSRLALADLQAKAKARDRVIAYYKCSARLAATLRSEGYAVVQTVQEAWLAPADFCLDSPALAHLRRKLRKAQKSRVALVHSDRPPLAAMALVSAAWIQANGAERGFSMGRFHPETLADQRVYLAYCGETLTAFLTWHCTANQWSLDLMRFTAAMPDGTMYALISKAIHDAKALGIASLSLAAVPTERPGLLCRVIDRATGATGLRQFKTTFAPQWRPLYLAARSPAALAVAAVDIALAITRPGPVLSAGPGHRRQHELAALFT